MTRRFIFVSYQAANRLPLYSVVSSRPATPDEIANRHCCGIEGRVQNVVEVDLIATAWRKIADYIDIAERANRFKDERISSAVPVERVLSASTVKDVIAVTPIDAIVFITAEHRCHFHDCGIGRRYVHALDLVVVLRAIEILAAGASL